MDNQKLYDFGSLFIKELGECVERCKKIGLANGLREHEIKKVIKTAFEILGKKSEISKAKLSQNLRRKKDTSAKEDVIA